MLKILLLLINLAVSRECLILSCLPKPSFADMACHVGDMSLVMSPTQENVVSARGSKRQDII